MTLRNLLACRAGSFGSARADAYRHMAQIGLTHVEVVMSDAADAHSERLRIDEWGLTCSSLQVALDIQAGTTDAFEGWCDACHVLETSLAFAAISSHGLPVQEVTSRLQAHCEVAQRNDITICIETHPDLAENMTVARRTLDAVGAQSLAICFDTGNLHYYNDKIDIQNELRTAVGNIGEVHLKQTNGVRGSYHFPGLDAPEGVVDWSRVFGILNSHGFWGPFTIEIEGIRGESRTPDEDVARVAASVRHLRDLGLVD